AAGGTNQPSDQGQEFGSSGPIALILIIVLFVAVAFLIRSMTRHLKKVPASFDPPEEGAETPAEDSADTGTADGREKQDH
ncbi:MAG TPA: hypothetical protein VJX10_08500, partial [Pseudonocardiaceae bacterium]|nr:hypothetical protein [Pseudonocardiaceae bacterium]